MPDVFAKRALQLRSARELVVDEESLASATALLSVHSGIALNDALLTVWNGKPTKAEDHAASVRATEAECRRRGIDAAGIKHLGALIRSKSAISYGEETVTPQKATALAQAAKRFETWTFKTCKELAQWDQ